MAGDEAGPELPVELADALRRAPGAREQWSQQSDELRQTYIQWVAGGHGRPVRRRRARRTAEYAARGVLIRSVQPARERSVSREIGAAVLWWMIATLAVGAVELLLAKLLSDRFTWVDLRHLAWTSAFTAVGAAAPVLWRHRRAPVDSPG
ncbi:Bacteriocin-protection, YdeI or OmpD-Associated [Parafrankia irregularis]|uniref:Bacteriocin-protection, YdeI or OmpD-Associated n=1 Tax=Parafrankia irregularis TaxID=795642 RepID=A0A0S4QIW0_9ACTN|nr:MULTISPECIES: YdeI/OmpD-associated family protein [Parafrankia]MBE3205673.1 YdeI/OmpD-associated family protein [Parafrankia sp. CH37]CUU55427.1 Bacteriocin-protection, YdeI or OmpD-Associated [Parafrankia irregularis]